MPTVGKSVQFRGIESAVNAYINQDVPKWGLFQGSQFLSKYEGTSITEGAELLKSFLDALDLRTADSATYTLCVYDGLADGEKIRSNTKYDGSFNFRLVDNIEGYQANKLSGGLEMRIAGIEQKLNEVLAPDETEVEEPTAQNQLMGALGKILEHPQIQQALANKLLGIIDGVGNVLGGMFQPGQPGRAAIGAAPSAVASNSTVMDENQKLQQAVNILVTIDAQLGTHLLQLAQIAAADPKKYDSLIGMLKLL